MFKIWASLALVIATGVAPFISNLPFSILNCTFSNSTSSFLAVNSISLPPIILKALLSDFSKIVINPPTSTLLVNSSPVVYTAPPSNSIFPRLVKVPSESLSIIPNSTRVALTCSIVKSFKSVTWFLSSFPSLYLSKKSFELISSLIVP